MCKKQEVISDRCVLGKHHGMERIFINNVRKEANPDRQRDISEQRLGSENGNYFRLIGP